MALSDRAREIYEETYPVGTTVTTRNFYENRLFWVVEDWSCRVWGRTRVRCRLVGIHPDWQGKTHRYVGFVEWLEQELLMTPNPLLVLAVVTA